MELHVWDNGHRTFSGDEEYYFLDSLGNYAVDHFHGVNFRVQFKNRDVMHVAIWSIGETLDERHIGKDALFEGLFAIGNQLRAAIGNLEFEVTED